ncbi:MAG: DUF4011 domain-containing protein, partial [Muribaculaceae bacterium]|nr:DUF4011 domain-containing protein [Muribaculaceae bacterium]
MHQIELFATNKFLLDYNPTLSYVELVNSISFIREGMLSAQNPLLNLEITASGSYFQEIHIHGDFLPGEKKLVSLNGFQPNEKKLQSLTDPISSEFKLSFSLPGNPTETFRFPVTLQAWNYWNPTEKSLLQSIASFIIPSQKEVSEQIEKVDQNEEEIITRSIALWNLLKGMNIRFSKLPQDFPRSPMLVQTPDMVSRFRRGTPLDTAVLLCSCLERMGINTILMFYPTTVLVGVCLKTVTADGGKPSAIQKNMWSDDPSIVAVDSLGILRGNTFDEAENEAEELLQTTQPIFTVNLREARKAGWQPLPIECGAASDEAVSDDYEIVGCREEESEKSRRLGWERKLLDLTLRNNMLNLRTGRNILPIEADGIEEVITRIKQNTLADVIGIPGKENVDQLKYIYRTSRTVLEENGTNTLFVAVGCLKWYDVGDSRKRTAPLVFIPVSISRRRASSYDINLREEEGMLNVTLMEMLRQMFGSDFHDLESIQEDKDGMPDWKKVLEEFSAFVDEINERQPEGRQWEVTEDAFLGLFSFKKFLMWNDIHTNPDIIDSHPVLKGLIENHYESSLSASADNVADLEKGTPLDLMLPVDYDSSQLLAVAESHAGRSFVLHGPPGTGKSQTITNMIADAIYNGRKVLFVAEKRAALEVVRARLNALGLAPYCLEIHSNKIDKGSFFAQLQSSRIRNLGISKPRPFPEEYEKVAKVLKKERNKLNEVTARLHKMREDGFSLYQSIACSLEKDYSDLSLKFDEIKHLSPADIEHLAEEFSTLDVIAEVIGLHPSESELLGLEPLENTADNQNGIVEILPQLREKILKARKKAASWINRWFFHKTAEELLHKDEAWSKLRGLIGMEKLEDADIDTVEIYLSKWDDNISGLRKWYHFTEKSKEISSLEFPAAYNFYMDGHSGDETANAIKLGYYKTFSENWIDNDAALRRFTGTLQEKTIEKYRHYIAEFQKLRREMLLLKMETRIRETSLKPVESRQHSLLMRRMLNKGRGVPLRKVVNDSALVLQKIFPCMLMSPLSVAQYLKMQPKMFDLIIFDEASQMSAPDAVGVIARGKDLIVVGDPMQLPPTRFFTSQNGRGEEVEESEDADSILEDCIAVGMPSLYLSRHYRSRHESLISFSNKHFYEGRLLTFPSWNDTERKVSFINPGGVYDIGRTRTNVIEAEAVVDKVIAILSDAESGPSIGVVAFSKVQSDLIEDILYARLQDNPELLQTMEDSPEPLFIKNLENVQGDERDIIIFSIGYGPDEEGNVSLNFGPINKLGGERRLNVAVSRAREEMLVYSSLLPSHFPDGIKLSKGAASLRDFLAFAIESSIPRKKREDETDDKIVLEIASALREKGYEVHTKIGRSAFKVDLAIVDANDPEKYCLGLILDGKEYNSLPTVRDREVTVPD